MKIIKLSELAGTEREVRCPKGGFVSFRFLLERDGMGFSLHKTVIPKGDKQHWHYKRHLEACYCVSGHGIIRDISSGDCHEILPDTLYALNNHDDHEFQALEETVLISVFNPPVRGIEVHKEDGSYE